MDEDRIIAEVAKRNGVLLTREDPILQISTMLALHAADHEERERRMVEQMAQLREAVEAKQLEAVMTDKQVAQLGRQVAASSNGAVRDLARAANRRSLALIVAAGVALFGAGGLVVWLLTPKPPVLTCSDQRGGIACGYWVTPPTEPAPASDPQTKTRKQ